MASERLDVVGEVGSISLTDKRLQVSGFYYNYINSYLRKTNGNMFIPISNILSMRYYKVRSKYFFMAFLYSGSLTILLKAIYELKSYKLIKPFTQLISGYLMKVYYSGLLFSSIMLLCYLFKEHKLIDIPYMGGRVCFEASDFNKIDIDKMINQFYKIKRCSCRINVIK